MASSTTTSQLTWASSQSPQRGHQANNHQTVQEAVASKSNKLLDFHLIESMYRLKPMQHMQRKNTNAQVPLTQISPEATNTMERWGEEQWMR
jgi:hypothetical protein